MTEGIADRFMGEGHCGMRRMLPMSSDRWAFLDRDIMDAPYVSREERQAASTEHHAFLSEIRRDVKSGKFKPAEILKQLSSGRRKSPNPSQKPHRA